MLEHQLDTHRNGAVPKFQTPPPRINAPAAAAGILDESLRTIRLEVTASWLFDNRPSLREAAERLAWMLTRIPRHPFQKKPLLDLALRDGLLAAFEAGQSGRNPIQAFLGRALTHACVLLEIDVRHGIEQWNPLHDVPLGAWLVDHPHANSFPTQGASQIESPKSFYANLCLRIVDSADMNEIRQYIENGRAD